jgi:hypothetical protein
MKLVCTILGHKHDPRHYGRVHLREREVDGLGTQHAEVTAECDRCERRFVLTQIHIPVRAVAPQAGR